MRLRIFFVERYRLQRGRLRLRISVERFYINVRQKKPGFCDPSPATRKCRIFFEGPLKKTERLSQILLAAFVREIEALQIKVVCLRVPLLMGGKRNSQLDLERVNNCASDFILQRKHALQFAFVSFPPTLNSVSSLNDPLPAQHLTPDRFGALLDRDLGV